MFDQRPPTVNAHIAKQISEYYQSALNNLLKPDVQSIGGRRFRVILFFSFLSSLFFSRTGMACRLDLQGVVLLSRDVFLLRSRYRREEKTRRSALLL